MIRSCRTVVVMYLVLLGLPNIALLVEPATPPPAAENEKLKERDRLEQEGQQLRKAGKTAEAIAAMEKALAIERAVFGKFHEDVAQTLRTLAELHAERGVFQAAGKEAQEALAIQSKLHGVKHWKATDAHRTLGWVKLVAQLDRGQRAKLTEANLRSDELVDLYLQGKPRDAIALGQQALEDFQQVLGEGHLDYATSLNNLGVLFHSTGKYRQAEPLYGKALEIFKPTVGELHPDYVTTFTNLAVLHGLKGDYHEALPLYRHALELRRQVVGEKHPDYVRSVNNLAWLHKIRGEYGLAEPLYLKALNLHKQGLSYGRPNARLLEIYRRVDLRRPPTREQMQTDRALVVGNLAVLYHEIGDYVRAEPLYRQTLDIYKLTLGEKSTEYARTLNNLAGMYQLMGDQARAELLLQQAVALRKQALGEKHPDYATSLHNLARFYHVLEDYDRAEALFLQALAIREKALGVNHPYYAQTLDKLARLYHMKKDYPRAEALYSEALKVRGQALGKKHRYDATIVTNQALLYQAMGNFDRAEALFKKSLDWTLKEMGDQNQEYARTMYNLAMLQFARKKYAEGERLARRSVHTSRKLMERCAAIQCERQQLAMSETTRYYLDGYLTLATAAEAPADRVYADVLAWKGAVTIRQQTMRRLRRRLEKSGQPEALKLYRDLEEATRRLASLSQAIAQQRESENLPQELERLSNEIERLEQALAGISETFRQGRAQQERTPAELSGSLPAETVLIDLLEYSHFSPPKTGKGELTSERRLAAFVLRRDRPIQRIDLGPAVAIAEAVAGWRRNMVRRDQDVDMGLALRRLLWEPLAKHVQGAKMVLVSPDGVVARLPWSVLPGKKAGTYLIEEYAMAVVPVPSQIPELLGRAREPAARSSIFLVGDVNFDAPPGIASQTAIARAAPHGSRSGTPLQWRHLPWTRTEIATIKEVFQRQFAHGVATDLRHEQATEEKVRLLAPQHRYVHFATHGFFASEALNPAGSAEKKPGASGVGSRTDVVGFHPGLLSGLVLAGANQAVQADRDDGILTTLEVAELDLSKVELAVLSACETGLGTMAGGEGVLGLQRAFHTAGAGTVVASLWQVPDQATRVLMERYYRNVWEKKLPKLQALMEAQLWMLKEGRSHAGIARGLVRKDVPQSSRDGRLPPYYWAAFVLSGDWR